jgi:peptidoglycan/xylan/chitin deacetylase (PgdA/CDA1 family)
MRLPVLLYHHVGPSLLGARYAGLSVSQEKFERQMRWLARKGYAGIRPAEWLAWLLRATALPPKPVLLTFDDAYADFPDYALPVLRRHGFRAVVFVVTGWIGARNSWDGAPLMSAHQIRECSAQGIEFGSHTRTHPDLTSLSGTQLREEIAGSGEDLSAIVGTRVTSFAYPYGFWSEEVRANVRESFDLAFTCDEGLNQIDTDPLLLRRTMVQPGDLLLDLACRVHFGWSPVTALRSRLRLRSRWRNAVRHLRAQSG